tara:strand:- start:98 stop:268 length:171 start_codon:yes stop_codon:yes gene_type:complete
MKVYGINTKTRQIIEFITLLDVEINGKNVLCLKLKDFLLKALPLNNGIEEYDLPSS